MRGGGQPVPTGLEFMQKRLDKIRAVAPLEKITFTIRQQAWLRFTWMANDGDMREENGTKPVLCLYLFLYLVSALKSVVQIYLGGS